MHAAFSNYTWKPRSSVRFRFALVQGVFITLIISVLAVALYFPVRSRLVSVTDQSYKILAENLAASIYSSFADGNVATHRQEIVNTVRNVERQQGVQYVLVINGDGLILYDTITGEKSLEGSQFTADRLSERAKRGDTVVGKIIRDDTTYYNYVAPFTSGQTNYTVRLGISQDTIDGQFNRLARLFLSLMAIGVVVGIAAAYFLASRLTKPIIKLTESALAIRSGNLNAYPDITTGDELEQLSREFQNMVEKLKQFYFQEFSQKKQALDAKKRLEDVNERLQLLDRQKSDFLNAASHQLRTPLSVIHWSLSIIMEDAAKLKLDKEQHELLDESLKSTKRMVDLVNELLDISRIEQGRKDLSWGKGNFASVCEQLVQALQVLAKNKNLELVFEREGDIPDSFLDEKQFYQAMNNFVDNAIKYTPEGKVTVRVQRDGENVEVAIADTGIGMSPDEKRNLFTRFSRGEQASKLFANGSGLGMYVAQLIIKQHGGSITVESEKGKGTTFTLHLPLHDAPPQTPTETVAEEEVMDKLAKNLKSEGSITAGS